MILIALLFAACEKSPFLSTRPDNALVVPASLHDMQALLDNDFIMNGLGSFGLVPALGETGADDYYITSDQYDNWFTPLYRHCYTWEKTLYAGEEIADWNYPYRCIFYANTVLEGLSRLSPAPADQPQWNQEKGSALFHRAHMWYQLAQVFAPPYDSATAATNPGVPLRMESDINEEIRRASVGETYGKILADLQEAVPLLPVTPLYKTRPSRPAAYALLARTCLMMGDYRGCRAYADSCLSLYAALLDYNTVNTADLFPFTRFNTEVIFCSMMASADFYPVAPTANKVDTLLFRSYEENDLRKEAFFKEFDGAPGFIGSYSEEYYFFAGLATDEVWLMRAECAARAGDAAAATDDLNTLRRMRYRQGTFTPLVTGSAEETLRRVLDERRRELLMRGLRWSDLRRLNQDPRFGKTLVRFVNGTEYTLPPNDPRYVYPIPDKVISLHPAMPQNPR